MVPRRLLGPLIISLMQLFFSCKPQQSQNSDTSAYLSHDQFEAARKIIAGIDYLPFGFAADGCYVRTIYMSMELAVAKIPSSAQVISICASDKTKDTAVPLKIPSGITWYYHVAPLAVVDGQEYIFDPSLKQTVWRRDEWKRQINQNQVPTYFQVYSADDNFVPLHPRDCGKDLGQEHMISTFEELRPFKLSKALGRCNLMHQHIAKAPGLSEAQRKYMQKRLIARTQTLLYQLDRLGKLDRGFFGKRISIDEVVEGCGL